MRLKKALKLLFSASLLCNLAFSLDSTSTLILDTYKKDGILKTQSLLDEMLGKKDYWSSYLQNIDVTYGYYESIKFIFISNKSAPDLSLYRYEDSKFEKIMQVDALIGKGKGEKQKEGDLTTPIGVYDILNKRTGLNQYYGPFALVTSYPNSYDKALKKTGYGIWIHGLPLDGNRKELNTLGCIAIENNLLVKYDGLLDYKKTLLITYEDILRPVSKDEIASILASIYSWKNSWANGDFAKYISFYNEAFVKSDGLDYKHFKDYKERVFKKDETKQINIKNINIAPYPNDDKKDIFLVTFMQDYKAFKNNSLSFASNNRKELYILLENGNFSILSEK